VLFPDETEKETGQLSLSGLEGILLFNDFQDLHGAGFDADAASDALGGGRFGFKNHNLHGAGFHALTAAHTLLLIDHVHASLGILGDGFMLAGAHALAALNASHGLSLALLSCDDLNAGQIGIELFIKSFRASLDTLQAGHALLAFFDSQFLHGY